MSISSLLYKLLHPRNTWHYQDYSPDLKLNKLADGFEAVYKGQLSVPLQPLGELASIFSGKTIFLLGTGPSINGQAIERLIGQTCLFLNGAITLCRSHQLQPSAWMVVDKGFIRKHPGFLALVPNGTPCIFTIAVVRQVLAVEPDFFRHHPLYLMEKANKPYNRPALKNEQLDPASFAIEDGVACSMDIQAGFAEAGTVMYAAAQLMLGLYPTKVILTGFDLGNADQPRFYETASNRVKSGLQKALQGRIIPAFRLLAKKYAERSILLTNASHLTSMPYDIIPFDDVLMRK